MATVQLPAALTITCASLFVPAGTLLFGLRFYTRHYQNARIGIDDWLMIPAYILVMGMQITMIVEVARHMIGYPDPNFKPGKADASTNLAFWPFELQQIPALGFIKLSIVFFYRRVFNTGNTPRYNWSTILVASLITLWTIGYFITWIFICGGTPANYWISAKNEKAYCVKTQELHLSFSVSDMILDWIVMLMVIPMIWHLQMSTSRKLAVLGIFGLGLVIIAASVTRMAIFVQATALRYDAYLDFEFLDTNGIYWGMVETGLGFITANLIIVFGLLTKIHPSSLFRSFRSKLFSRTSGRTSGGESQTDLHTSSPSKRKPSDIEEISMDDYNIRVERQFGTPAK